MSGMASHRKINNIFIKQEGTESVPSLLIYSYSPHLINYNLNNFSVNIEEIYSWIVV